MEITLYILSLIGSGVGFMTQMLVSGYWTTAFSQDVFYFSINLATYFLSLGVGSLFSTRIQKPNLRHLAWVMFTLLLISGAAIPFLRLGIKQFGNMAVFPQVVVICAGLLNGMVIPLTLKMGENFPRMSLGFLFFIDYSAATLFAFLFTFVFLIPLGYSKTALILCVLCNLAVVVNLIWQKQLKALEVLFAVAALVLPILFYFASGAHVAPTMDRTGVARIIHNEQSHYQKIVLTEEKLEDLVLGESVRHMLFLDGFVQFSSSSENNYHLCLADIPIVAASFQKSSLRKVLILGGGDGLAARNVLKTSFVEKVTLVELDPAMIQLAKNHLTLRGYNQDSLSNPKVEVVIADAFRWVQENRLSMAGKYDLIIIDFPAPKNLTLARLFSAEFYRGIFQLLTPSGFVSIQAGPSYSYEDSRHITLSKITTSILKTIESLGYKAFPYVTTADSEAFVLSTKDSNFNMEKFSRSIGIYTGGGMSLFCRYDDRWIRPEAEKNTLNTLKVSTYMIDWFKRSADIFFNYRGNHLVFLPE